MDVRESGRRVVRYQVVSFAVMRLLGGWLAKIPEYELKLEIGRHVWQDAQAAEALRVRSPASCASPPMPIDDRRSRCSAGWTCWTRPAHRSNFWWASTGWPSHVCGAMVDHVESTDPVCDAPTLRTLRPSCRTWLTRSRGVSRRSRRSALAARRSRPKPRPGRLNSKRRSTPPAACGGGHASTGRARGDCRRRDAEHHRASRGARAALRPPADRGPRCAVLHRYDAPHPPRG